VTLGIFVYMPWGRLKTYEVLESEDVDEAVKLFEETRRKCLKTELLYLTRADKGVDREQLRMEYGLNE